MIWLGRSALSFHGHGASKVFRLGVFYFRFELVSQLASMHNSRIKQNPLDIIEEVSHALSHGITSSISRLDG